MAAKPVRTTIAADGQGSTDDDLLPLVYDQLRSLARHMVSRERPGQTLQATALVHEAYMRLSHEDPSRWQDRKHFYLVAAQAMRRILIDRTRRRRATSNTRDDVAATIASPDDKTSFAGTIDLVDLDEALRRLSNEDPRAAQLVALRFFAGLTIDDAADTLGISRTTAKRDWSYVRAWLRSALHAHDEPEPARE